MNKNFIVDVHLKEFSCRGKKDYYCRFKSLAKDYCYLKSALNFALNESCFSDVSFVNIYDCYYNRLYYCVSGKLFDCKALAC